jgi:signal transduction histidine kinase
MEDRPNLFKPYFKTKDDKSRSINKESHGLGLNICKKIAINLGGDLVLNEHYNQGA